MKLQETWAKGTQQGSTLVATVEGVSVQAEVGAAFLQMAARARVDGVSLILNSGFRSHEDQSRLWRERQDPEKRKTKGPAARPGYSRHQNGKAIDIITGLTSQGFLGGDRSGVFDWLDRHAHEFGFVRTVQSEPWHWVYTREVTTYD